MILHQNQFISLTSTFLVEQSIPSKDVTQIPSQVLRQHPRQFPIQVLSKVLSQFPSQYVSHHPSQEYDNGIKISKGI